LRHSVQSKFALGPHHVWKYGRPNGRHQSATAENRRGKKIEEETTVQQKKKRQYSNIMPAVFRRAAIINQ